MLNTKQVRAVARNANINFVRTYTDKTLTNKNSPRRSVVFVLSNFENASRLYNVLSATIKNPIKRTATVRNYATQCAGFHYVRVIANI